MTDFDSDRIKNISEYNILVHYYVALLHQWGYAQHEDVDLIDFNSVKQFNASSMQLLEQAHWLMLTFAKRRQVFLAHVNRNPRETEFRGISSPMKTPEIRHFDDLAQFVFKNVPQSSTAWRTRKFPQDELEELSIRRLRRDLYDKKIYFDEVTRKRNLLDSPGTPD